MKTNYFFLFQYLITPTQNAILNTQPIQALFCKQCTAAPNIFPNRTSKAELTKRRNSTFNTIQTILPESFSFIIYAFNNLYQVEYPLYLINSLRVILLQHQAIKIALTSPRINQEIEISAQSSITVSIAVMYKTNAFISNI